MQFIRGQLHEGWLSHKSLNVAWKLLVHNFIQISWWPISVYKCISTPRYYICLHSHLAIHFCWVLSVRLLANGFMDVREHMPIYTTYVNRIEPSNAMSFSRHLKMCWDMWVYTRICQLFTFICRSPMSLLLKPLPIKSFTFIGHDLCSIKRA